MHLDSLFDSLYVLNALWGGLSGSAVCSAPLPVLPRPIVAVDRMSASGVVTAFVDVNVVPMDTERVLAHHTVLVDGERITALGPVNQVKVPAGAVRIDGRGKYLIPGLSDMHTHNPGTLTFESMRKGRARDLANGVVLIRYNTPVSLALKQVWNDSMPAEAPTPRLYLAPPIPPMRADSLSVVITAAQSAGYDHLVMWNGYNGGNWLADNPVAYDSLLAAARRSGLPLAAHDVIPYSAFDRALALGAVGGSNEHVYLHWVQLGGRPKGMKGYDSSAVPLPDISIPKLEELVAATRRAGLWISPTVRCSENEWPSPTHTKAIWQIVKAFQDAGVGLLLGQDDGWDVHDELTALIRVGLTPYQALLTGTRNAAQYLRELDTRGTVAVGKRADLVLLSGNPLENIRYTREPAGVMLGGLWRDRVALDRLLLVTPDREPWLMWAVNQRGIKGDPQGMKIQLRKREALDPQLGTRDGNDIHDNLEPERRRLMVLTDSLRIAQASGASGAAMYQRVAQQVVAELGAVRAKLTPAQHELFDPIVRVWLREEIRQGRSLAIPGVRVEP